MIIKSKIFQLRIFAYTLYEESINEDNRWRNINRTLYVQRQHSSDNRDRIIEEVEPPSIRRVDPPGSQRGLTDDRISRFESFRADQESVDDGCAICIDGVEINKMMIKLDCSHFYCGECIRKWLENNRTCPLCKREFENWLWML